MDASREDDPEAGVPAEPLLPEPLLVELLAWSEARYGLDEHGRLPCSGTAGPTGDVPWMVLARSADGVGWRLRADLRPATVVAVSRLAGREPAPGPPRGEQSSGEASAAAAGWPLPERLHPIEEHLRAAGAAGHRQRLRPWRLPPVAGPARLALREWDEAGPGTALPGELWLLG